MRLLVVEDSEKLRRSLSAGLRAAGYAVDETADGNDALWRAETTEYDVMLLDIMLPGIDGLTVLKRLRSQRANVYVLLLTARDSVDDRVRGLRMGADDYLIKPFDFDELLARVETLIRRRHGLSSPAVEVGDLRIDQAAKTVTRQGTPVDLSPREFSLLEYLVAQRGRVVSRTEIEAHLYDDRSELMSNVVDSAICALRRKIDPVGRQSYIQTRRGFGYVLDAREH